MANETGFEAKEMALRILRELKRQADSNDDLVLPDVELSNVLVDGYFNLLELVEAITRKSEAGQ